jgi:HEAT repeat protein
MHRLRHRFDNHALTLRVIRLACLVAALTQSVSRVEAQDALAMRARNHASSGYLHVQIADNIVTVEARDVTVEALLREIARQSGLAVLLHDPLDERVTLELQGLPLSEAIRRILRDQSFALRYVGSPQSAENPNGEQPDMLWVFSKRPRDDHASLITRNARRAQGPDDSLGTPDADEGVVPLSLALADDDVKVRLKAVSALIDIGGEQAAAALAAVTLSDKDASVREEAVYGLGEIGGETGMQVLEQALMDPDGRVREAAVEAFTDIGGSESARALAVALNNQDASLRAEAVDALGEIGGETAIRVLRQALADEQSFIREAAAEFLAELASQEP